MPVITFARNQDNTASTVNDLVLEDFKFNYQNVDPNVNVYYGQYEYPQVINLQGNTLNKLSLSNWDFSKEGTNLVHMSNSRLTTDMSIIQIGGQHTSVILEEFKIGILGSKLSFVKLLSTFKTTTGVLIDDWLV